MAKEYDYYTISMSFVSVDGETIEKSIGIPQEHDSGDLILAILRVALDLQFKASQ